MEKEKKKWETPKLICLYRGRPEEAVLAGCKFTGTAYGPGGGIAQVEKRAANSYLPPNLNLGAKLLNFLAKP